MVFRRRLIWLARWSLSNPSPGPRTASQVSSRDSSLDSCLTALGCPGPGPAYQEPQTSLSPLCKRDPEAQAQRSQRENRITCDMWSILVWPYQQQADCWGSKGEKRGLCRVTLLVPSPIHHISHTPEQASCTLYASVPSSAAKRIQPPLTTGH